jgi:hypothetical protein
MINSRRMRWIGHVARIIKKSRACKFLGGKTKGTNINIDLDYTNPHIFIYLKVD